MSPVAVGNPHTRLSLTGSGATINMASNGATTNGSSGAKRVLPHLDDLVIAKPDVDIKSPLRTILLKGELLAKQADTHLDFRRPDIALQEYVCASTIAVDIVPRHPDYLALQKDRGDLHRLYIGLNKRINAQHKKFAEVKELVKEDNARSGVQPTTRNQGTLSETNLDYTPSIPLQQKSGEAEHTNLSVGPASHQKKTAPAVQPKPDGLHGRAISHPNGPNNVSDLAARFARLQNGVPTQDPRIKTRPISVMAPSVASPSSKPESRSSMIRPLGPRELPAVPTTQPRVAKIPLDVTIPGMPRPPDAIHHSPLRTVGNADTNSLPSSASRIPSFLGHTRKDSAPPISTVGPSPYVSDKRSDYFTSPTHSSHDISSVQSGKPDYSLPESTTITAEDLMKYLRQGQQALKVLIVDLRNREDFESGHILSQFTICVEPLTLRSGMSGQELEDSMIIGPSYEQELFEQRADFDLLVFYDQSSSSIKLSSVGKDKDSILRDFASAVYDYGYEKRLKRRPVLLAGGLDSWVDLLGPNCLTTTGVSGENIHPGSIITSSASSKQLARRSQTMASRRRSRPSRLVSSEEEHKWDHVLREDSLMTNGVKSHAADTDELFYARTPEDFLRRFPELPPVQESMISPATVPFKQIQHELDGVMSRAPARPAPALPRQRSYGIMDKGASFQYTHGGGGGGSGITNTVVQPGLTGLKNMLGVQCYMNAAVQMISATPALRAFLMNLSLYPASIVVPAKAEETSPPLQLMGRSLGNLLSHMWSGQYNYLSSKTFCSYVNALHSTRQALDTKVRDRAFGGRARQHDSSEFLLWVLNTLEDETNPRRDAPQTQLPANNGELLYAMSEATAAANAMRQTMLERNSPVTLEMGCLTRVQIACRDANCAGGTRTYALQIALGPGLASLPPRAVGAPNPTFRDLLDTAYNPPLTTTVNGTADPVNTIDWNCSIPTCSSTRGVETTKLARMPNTLFVALNRTNFVNVGVKLLTIINFQGEQQDLSTYFADFQGHGTDPEYTPPFIYDIVTISEHIGTSLEYGHYITYSKMQHPTSGQSSWWKFNDSVVTQSSFREATAGTVTYIVLQRRRNTPAP